MSARVLVVDDIKANVKLLEAKLKAEYYDVLTAFNGEDALKIIEEEHPDIVLLDVMMPGMDGFEVCQAIRSNPKIAHIPVVLVTALDQPQDRVQGLKAGADDFLTKPVNDIALCARVKSLVRLKMMTDELMLRQSTGEQMGLVQKEEDVTKDQSGRILVIEDRRVAAQQVSLTLSDNCDVVVESDEQEVLIKVRSDEYDVIIVSLDLQEADGLRLCSQLRTIEATRGTPILAISDEGEMKRLLRGLDLGVNDYVTRPLDHNELKARVQTLLKRKKYQDRLRENLQLSLELAISDQLTSLYNRRYMETHLGALVRRAKSQGKPLSILMMDIDHFKAVNDTHGHAVGDEVLIEFSSRLKRNVRGLDLACRFGGEEFVVVMPETDGAFAYMVAERLRQDVADITFETDAGPLDITLSIGIACLEGDEETGEEILKRADHALYKAKGEGRNRVETDAANAA